MILERVGAGGMGVVFSAYDPELDRRVAIKVLASDLIEEEARLRLLREAQAMARLSHPNVVPVYDAGTVDGQVFVAMEFVQGVTLREWLARESHEWTEVLETMRRAAFGLQSAHEAGLIHRDFKPDNVMVGDDGRVRVLDFGLARSASVDSVGEAQRWGTGPDASPVDVTNSQRALALQMTSEGAMLGTPAYMPPEQLEGQRVDARTDQWSFCVTLYEALYGVRPFDGDTVAAFVLAMHNDGVRPPPDSSPVPRSIFAALRRGLELEPQARHPSMRDLLDALEPAPSRHRMRPLWGVALVGVVAAGWWWSAQRADDACASRRSAAAEIWSSEARRAGADAFERSAVPYGSETWSRTAERVSDYATAWGEAAERACRAAGPGTEEVDALRNRCLDARLRRLSSVVDAFASANDEVVRGAVATAYGLPALEPCADVSRLLAAVSPPEDPEDRAELTRLEVALEDAVSRRLSKDYTEGARRARAVVDQARQLAYDPFTAEALATLASFTSRRGEYEAARELYVEGFELAATARDDAGAASAAVDLVYLLGAKLQVPAAADAWTTVGATMLERAGLRGQAPEASFHNAVGNVALSRGDHARALSEFSAAREIWEALPGQHPVDMGFVLSNIGVVQSMLGNYDEARKEHLQALKIREETFGTAHPEVAMSLGNLGIVAARTGDVDAARDYQERALAIKRAALPPGHPSLADTALNLGLLLARTGDVERAIESLEEAVEIRTASYGDEHADVAVAMGGLADAYRRQGGRNDEAEALHRRALAIQREALGPNHPSVAGSLQNLAVLMLAMGRPEEAVPLAEEALAIFTKAFGPEHAAVVHSWLALSGAHDANGRLEEAIEAAEEGVAAAEQGGQDEFRAGAARARLGMLRWKLGEDRSAARALVANGRAAMAKTPEREPEEQAQVEAWLRSNPLPQ